MSELELITQCCKGKVWLVVEWLRCSTYEQIYETEVKCQSLYTLDEVMTQISDPHTPYPLKGVFIRFLEEVASQVYAAAKL